MENKKELLKKKENLISAISWLESQLCSYKYPSPKWLEYDIRIDKAKDNLEEIERELERRKNKEKRYEDKMGN